MGNFTENTRVQVPAALHLIKLGYDYIEELPEYEPNTNILTDIFIASCQRLNPRRTREECEQMLRQIVSLAANDDLGRELYSLISTNSDFRLIDFEKPKNNVWHVTTEFTCEDHDTGDNFRPDLTCFINGLPLAFIEVKKPNNREGILAERDRINSRMNRSCFRRFLNLTQLMIFSNNQEYEEDNTVPIQGAFYCCAAKGKAFFNVFREEVEDYVEKYPYRNLSLEDEKCVLRHRNCVQIKTLPEYKTNQEVHTPTNRILTSMLSRERILFMLRYGITYVDKAIELEDGTMGHKLEKHIMRYQQFFASLAIRKRLNEGVKSGIIWHTQGSGKTELAYYSVRSLTDYYAARDTAVKFYFIVDRIDLMVQASDEFKSRGLIVRNADSRADLMANIADNRIVYNDEGKPEINVVNIQQFKEDHSQIKLDGGYNTRLQHVFFIDEAHRGYNPKGSFLANLLEADKDAVKIALTGTPLLREERESWRVFGDYINVYYYDKSIADGYTRRLMREPVETVYKETLKNILDELTAHVEVKKSDIDRDKIIEHESYLNALLDFIIHDFRQFRIGQNDDTVGAMIVCKTNPQARKLYDLWTRRFEKARQVTQQQEEAYMASEDPMTFLPKFKPLRAALILHDEGDKIERKQYIDEFKKTQTIDVLIVNQMLLTGFDAPRLKKLYLGRSLDGHDLLQALTRVNRPYRDFKYGYVVDFVNIKENFDATNDRYLRELGRTEDTDTHSPAQPGEVLLVDKDEIKSQMGEIKATLFNFTTNDTEEFRKEIDEITSKDSLYTLRTVLNNAKAIQNQIRAFGDDELKKEFGKIPLGGLTDMLREVTHRIERLNLIQNTEHKADVSGIINVALHELEFLFKPGTPEELRIVINDLRERGQRVQAEFNANFDQQEERYVSLADEFREYFRKKGFVPQDTRDAKECIQYMDAVMARIREINSRNNQLKKKYKGDERFVRVHKRILEHNERQERPLISKKEYEIALNLVAIKDEVDGMLFNNIYHLDNESDFNQDVLRFTGLALRASNICSELSDREYISNLIASEYTSQYQNNRY